MALAASRRTPTSRSSKNAATVGTSSRFSNRPTDLIAARRIARSGEANACLRFSASAASSGDCIATGYGRLSSMRSTASNSRNTLGDWLASIRVAVVGHAATAATKTSMPVRRTEFAQVGPERCWQIALLTEEKEAPQADQLGAPH